MTNGYFLKDGEDVFHQERDVWGVPGREGRAGGEPNGGADTQLQRKRGAAVGDQERGERSLQDQVEVGGAGGEAVQPAGAVGERLQQPPVEIHGRLLYNTI